MKINRKRKMAAMINWKDNENNAKGKRKKNGIVNKKSKEIKWRLKEKK